MVGYAVGLGNFWRFPYLCYTWGGALFFIPYFVCLFFIGIPVTLMELALGQKFQRGDVGVFRGIHPRLAGVGGASVLAAYYIVTYYNIIIGWSLIYLVMAFINPLPWSTTYTTDGKHKDCDNLFITEEVFYKDIARTINDDCTKLDTSSVISETSVFGWEVYLATLAVWIIVYFIMWKGVKSSSYVVWITVPLPVIFIFVMVMNGLTLENADDGIRMYLKGYDAEGNPPDLAANISNGKMWAQACGQIFFSLGICMGTMTGYSSFNDVNKPIIGDGIKIALINSGISFFAGFAVFSVVGYLIGIDSPVSDETASVGLAFVAYPAAIETMPGSNFWAFILAVTLFTLGIDSSFSILEAPATVMSDSAMFKGWSKKVNALLLCITGSLCSILFCFNWGFTFFDVIDNYLNTYLMLLIGVFETMGAGWVYEASEITAKSRAHKMSLYVLAIGYWSSTILIPCLSVFTEAEKGWIGLIIFVPILIMFWVISFFLSGLSFGEWKSNIACYGVRKLSRSMTKLSRNPGEPRRCWETVFEHWWGFSIKYFVPYALMFLLTFSLNNDLRNAYGDYHIFW